MSDNKVLNLQKERLDLLLEIIDIREKTLDLCKQWQEKAIKIVEIENNILEETNAGLDKNSQLKS